MLSSLRTRLGQWSFQLSNPPVNVSTNELKFSSIPAQDELAARAAYASGRSDSRICVIDSTVSTEHKTKKISLPEFALCTVGGYLVFQSPHFSRSSVVEARPSVSAPWTITIRITESDEGKRQYCRAPCGSKQALAVIVRPIWSAVITCQTPTDEDPCGKPSDSCFRELGSLSCNNEIH